MIPGQSASRAGVWPHAAVTRGIGLPGAAPQLACKKYQEMTRFAASSGDRSGPYPAWDPV